jgi:hypothetical protein
MRAATPGFGEFSRFSGPMPAGFSEVSDAGLDMGKRDGRKKVTRAHAPSRHARQSAKHKRSGAAGAREKVQKTLPAAPNMQDAHAKSFAASFSTAGGAGHAGRKFATAFFADLPRAQVSGT